MSKSPKPGNMAADLVSELKEVTAKWTKTKKAEERAPGSVRWRSTRMTAPRGISFKEAAESVMEEAYMKASANGTLPANARQIMYAARPKIQEITGKPLEHDQYFTQTLLPNYIEENGLDWDVVFDARGHFTEPHTEKVVSLGTLNVRGYLSGTRAPRLKEAKIKLPKVKTKGPDGNFGAVLLIEKEGFNSLLERAEIAQRYDLAIMSTKGMSTTAARKLIDEICGGYIDIPLFVLHDFDVAGFTILDRLRNDTRRYSFINAVDVIDLGLRLDDVNEMGLQAEDAAYSKADEHKTRRRLISQGASGAEADFLVEQRVELNAMASDEFVDFVKRKLDEHGVKKIIPDEELLSETFRLFERGRRFEEAVENMQADSDDDEDDVVVPINLVQQVTAFLEEHPTLRWDEAVKRISSDDPDEPDPPTPKRPRLKRS